MLGTGTSISQLDQALLSLPPQQKDIFERIFRVVATVGELRAPETMHPWIQRQFGTVEAVEQQKIVRVLNRVTLEDAIFNALRSQRPMQMRDGEQLMKAMAEARPDDPLCQPLENTPEDVFGRVTRGHAITAANIAKLDGFSSLIVFDNHNPLEFTREQVVDYINAGWEWAHRANQHDPTAVYYFFLWNCLWRAGASLLHGHAQMLLGRHVHYGKVELLRRTALRYQEQTGHNYFEDLFAAHEALGLGFRRDGVRILAYLTPTKEREIFILADPFDPVLPERVYDVLACYRDKLGVISFNLTLYQGPIGRFVEDWSGFPNIVRILDRGDPTSQTSDIGSMELYAASVVASDPFQVAEVLRSSIP